MAQAIVTGGAIRVGKAISLALADAGYDVILLFHNSFEEARDVAREIEDKKGRRCFIYKCDISKKESIDNFFMEISRKHDDVRLLVNSASIFGKYGFMETSEQIFDAHMNINFKAPFFLCQNYVQYVRKRAHITNAHIVNILDKKISGIHTGHFAYFLSKKVLLDLTKMLSKDLIPVIRVNAVSLGSILPANEFEPGKHGHSHTELSDRDVAALKMVTDQILHLDKTKNLTAQNIIVEPETKAGA